jgi:hypothetical protein
MPFLLFLCLNDLSQYTQYFSGNVHQIVIFEVAWARQIDTKFAHDATWTWREDNDTIA